MRESGWFCSLIYVIGLHQLQKKRPAHSTGNSEAKVNIQVHLRCFQTECHSGLSFFSSSAIAAAKCGMSKGVHEPQKDAD